MKRSGVLLGFGVGVLCLCFASLSLAKSTESDRLYEKGNKAFQSGDYVKAISFFSKGLMLLEKYPCSNTKKRNSGGGHPVDTVMPSIVLSTSNYTLACNINLKMADAYFRLSDYSNSLLHYTKSLKTSREYGLMVLYCDSLKGIGNCHSMLCQYDKALSSYNDALSAAQSIGYQQIEGRLLVNIGFVYYQLSQNQIAIKYYEQALNFAKNNNDVYLKAIVSHNYGNVYFHMGLYKKALGYLLDAVSVSKKMNDLYLEERALGDVGNIYYILDENTNSLHYYQQSLVILQKIKDVQNQGRILRRIGQVWFDKNNIEKAGLYYNLSFNASKKVNDVIGQIYSLFSIGDILLSQKKFVGAYDHYYKAVLLARKHQIRRAEAVGLQSCGDVLAKKDIHKARGMYLLALATLAEIGEPNMLSLCLHSISMCEVKISNFGMAIYFGKQAVNGIQAIRQNITGMDKSLQKSFLDSKEHIYKSLADILIDQGRLPEAQQVLAMLKEEEYFDFVRRDASGADAQKTPISLTPAEKEADATYAKASESLVTLGKDAADLQKMKPEARSEAENARLKDLRAQLDAAQKQFQQTLAEIEKGFKQQGEKRSADLEKKQLDTDLREMVSELGQGVTLVHYLMLSDSLRILVTTPEVIQPHKVEIKEADLNRLVKEFRDALQNPGVDPSPVSKKLYAALIAPIEQDLQAAGTKTLMVSLDGALRYLPLAALQDDKGYLAQRYAVDVFTEAARDKMTKTPSQEWKLAGFGVSQAHPPLFPQPLVAVPEELAGIVGKPAAKQNGVLPGEEHLDKDFTRDSLRDALDVRYPVLHIASHFRFDPADNLSSFLLLGDGSHLSLSDIREGDYKLGGVDLLTLSACETAMGGNGASGREVEGFGALAQKKGAKGVLATLWSVNDASTGAFMREFYRLRQEEHLTKAEALRRAQVAFIDGKITSKDGNYAHPFFWAPFILMGNWL